MSKKVNLNKVSAKQAKEIEDQISKKLGQIIKEANLKANKFLDQYGLEVQMALQINEKEEKTSESQSLG